MTSLRSLSGFAAAALLCIGCAAPAIEHSQGPSAAPRTPSIASASATATPTLAPTKEPTPTAIASNTCTHPQGVYTVSYPTGWYSNVGSDTYIACTAFGPEPLGDDQAADPGVAITLIAEPDLGWNNPLTPLSGEFAGYLKLVDEAATIGGRRAWVRVYELTLAEAPDNNVGDLSIAYSVELENDWFLTGLATANPDAYPDLRDVLVTMLAGLDIP